MNVNLESYEDMTLVYSFFDYIDQRTLGCLDGKIGLVALFSRKKRFDEIYCRCNKLSHETLPLDISKFDNNVQLWMMGDIC